MEQTDFHTQQEDEFLRSIISKLDTAVQAGQIKSIILVAPPRAIGVLRQGYTHVLKQAVREEIQKGLREDADLRDRETSRGIAATSAPGR